MCSPMTTGQVAEERPEACFHEKEDEIKFRFLHMDWVLASDTKGDPRPTLHWQVD
jgi:hypothetical protein